MQNDTWPTCCGRTLLEIILLHQCIDEIDHQKLSNLAANRILNLTIRRCDGSMAKTKSIS